MDDFLAKVPLIGIGPILVISAIALFFLVMGIMAWRRHRLGSVLLLLLFAVVGLGAVADAVNTHFAYYDNVAQMLGIPTYPTGDAADVSKGGDAPSRDEPNGAVVKLTIPDTKSKFGSFDANVWLPPQYSSDTRAHFPVIMLIAGNPGSNDDWLNGSRAAQTALAAAKAGRPVILVFPTAIQNRVTGDSLCLDTTSQGNAETYLTQDVIAAVDDQLRTRVDPKQRGIGGLSMGGYCALNLGLKHPDLFSVALDFSGETQPVADTLPGGLQELFGPGWQQRADANDPTKYYSTLDARKGPALWLDVGASDTDILNPMQKLVTQLKSKGFTVEFHTRPGSHDFATFGDGLADALPWASTRFYSP